MPNRTSDQRGTTDPRQDVKAPEPWHRHCLLRGHQGEVCDVASSRNVAFGVGNGSMVCVWDAHSFPLRNRSELLAHVLIVTVPFGN